MRSFIAVAVIGIVCLASPVRLAAQDRMPPIAAEKLTDAQKTAIEDFKAARSAEVSGPFVPLVRSPEVMSRARAMGDYLRFRSVLPPRLSELVILLKSTVLQSDDNWKSNLDEARDRVRNYRHDEYGRYWREEYGGGNNNESPPAAPRKQ